MSLVPSPPNNLTFKGAVKPRRAAQSARSSLLRAHKSCSSGQFWKLAPQVPALPVSGHAGVFAFMTICLKVAAGDTYEHEGRGFTAVTSYLFQQTVLLSSACKVNRNYLHNKVTELVFYTDYA